MQEIWNRIGPVSIYLDYFSQILALKPCHGQYPLYHKHLLTVKFGNTMRNILLVLLTICISSTATFSSGRVETITFFSDALQEEREINVYLPDGYDDPENEDTHYPLFLFLHGASSQPSTYSQFATMVYDPMISNGQINPVIIAYPDGRAEPYAGSFYTNSELYGDFETYITSDVITHLDNTYRTLADPQQRCIYGHSMGGFGSMKLAFQHPDLFTGVASLSGPLDLAQVPNLIPVILDENGGSGPYSPEAGTFSYLGFSMAGAFSPNLDNEPEPVDMPFDNDGNLIDEVFDLWLANSPSVLARENPVVSLGIYFDCGTEDELQVFPFNEAFEDSLTAQDITCTFESYTGGHANQLLNRVPIATQFLDELVSQNRVNPPQENLLPASISISNAWPNPFNASTSITITVNRPVYGSITVYGINGQRVEQSNRIYFTPGETRYTWNSTGTASGTYLVQVQAGTSTRVLKTVLLK